MNAETFDFDRIPPIRQRIGEVVSLWPRFWRGFGHLGITAFSEEQLMDAYASAAADGTRAVILNFTGLEYMNSGGIGLLVTVLVRANRAKQKLLAFGLTDHCQQIFELTRLNEAIGIYETEADAVAAAA